MKLPKSLKSEELVRLPDTSQYFRTRAITYSDPGIMRDEVAIKLPFLERCVAQYVPFYLSEVPQALSDLEYTLQKVRLKKITTSRSSKRKKRQNLNCILPRKKLIASTVGRNLRQKTAHLQPLRMFPAFGASASR